MSWTVYITEVAREELDEAHSYYEAKQPGLGTDFLVEIEAIMPRLESNPYQFPERFLDLRAATLQRFPFLVVYRVQEASLEVDVVAIANTYQDPKRWQKR